MIFFIYQQGAKNIKILEKNEDGNNLDYKLTKKIWQLAETYPDYIIGWCADELFAFLDLDSWEIIFHHDLIMASFAHKTTYISDSIGYVDQLPFININLKVLYPTWKMSTDVGGIKGMVLIKFKDILKDIEDFGFLLNSVSKLGQQHGLFCYSTPRLLKINSHQFEWKKVKKIANTKEMFSFIFAHYKTIRVFLLFWCYIKYEQTFPFKALLTALFQKKYFKKHIDLSGIELKSNKPVSKNSSIDVIIPTLGRRDYLLQVMEDLKAQTLLPKRVIIIEQDSSPGSQTELPELKSELWPFEVVHHFINKTGACNARNIALDEVKAGWVFFADDDIRLNSTLLEQSLSELNRLGSESLNINCKQEGEETVFHKIKQWGSFGSGTSIVKANYCKKIRFDEIFEYGFGEDQDYGMQLRNAGCDIIYHPFLEILHLKASRGGFRDTSNIPWEKDKPKPSPTLMLLVKKYYTSAQLKGYKNEMYLRYYSKQAIKNPFNYIKIMRKRWRKSEEWADKLISNKEGRFLKTE